MFRSFVNHPCYDLSDFNRNGGGELSDGTKRLVALPGQRIDFAGTETGQQREQSTSQSINIGTGIGMQTVLQLLGSCVFQRSDTLVAEDPGKTEFISGLAG